MSDRQLAVDTSYRCATHLNAFVTHVQSDQARATHIRTLRGQIVGAVPLVKLDLKKFYPSVDGAQVSRFFTGTMRCSPDVAALLTRLCTFENHVPTGRCVSQLLAFFAAKPLFDELHSLAVSAGVRDSCYVDDLTWSGQGATPAFLWAAKLVVHRHGFQHHKDRCFAAGDRKLVAGVMLDGNRIAVLPSKEFDLWKNTQALGGVHPRNGS